jgi:hypothetical protein
LWDMLLPTAGKQIDMFFDVYNVSFFYAFEQ